MSYNKTVWHSKDIITRAKMQKIEDQLELLSNKEGMEIHVCTSGEYNTSTGVPTITNPSTSTIYLTPGQTGTNDMYVEWIYANGSWEKFGSTTAAFTETDPTVPAWAKTAEKPTYTAAEVGALPNTTVIPTKTSDLTNDSGYLTSHQDISGKVDSNSLAAVATSGNYNDLSNKPSLDPFEFFATQNVLSNAGFHNSIYRGKNLGTEVTAEQWQEISNGTFRDMYIGDYWMIDGEKKVIAHFNYYKNCGNTNFTKNHIIVINATNMNLSGYYDLTERLISGTVTIGTKNYSTESATGFRWNARYTEPAEEGAEGTWANWTGLYIDSHIYNDVLPAAQAKVEAGIGADHLLWCRKLFPSACNASDASPTSGAWTGSATRKLDLLNETQVYGQAVWATSAYEVGTDKTQLAIFRLDPSFANIRVAWWLRSVNSATWACSVSYVGGAHYTDSAQAIGVRPLEIWG